GVCTKGNFACVGGVLVCQGGTQPQPEVCDGVDNDCDLAVDEGPLSDAPSQAGCWNPAAAPTTGKSCSHQGIGWNPPAGATCNGVGTLTSPCATGTLTCGGNQGWTCQGGTLPGGEICDGIDNDCDGQLDQNDPSITGTGPNVNCGTDVGVCEFGDLLCVNGVPSCVGGTTPVPEICNNQDDDCDGTPDEGNPGGGATCGSNTGACQSGTTACVSGALVCQGEITSTAELCDGVDNDCDGAIDDDLTDIPPNLGCWNTAPGACTGGGRTWTAPAGATCTGLGALTSPCSAGTLFCSGLNKWQCAGGQVPAASETCDGVDNDCDGQTDEGTGGGQCGTAPNVLPCKRGTFQCVAGQLSCQGEILPSNELCNNVDDNCDGTVDNGITAGVGNECGSNVGICKKGLTACVAGSVQCSGATGSGTEVCNGLDDDCDGIVDNNLSDAPADPDCWNLPGTACTEKGITWGRPAGVTDCKGLGGLTAPCSMGALTCVGTTGWACLGGQNPGPELCDGIDNDCDGTPDDGNPGGGVTCGSDVGACEFGQRNCVSGQLTCSGGTPPSPETCNNIDDNCDGRVDEPENVVGLGQICGTDVGPCVSGILECGPGGVPVCRGEVKGSAETCNGIDDDCDGTIDELPTDAPADPGCWAVTGTTCSFRSLTWSPPAGATCTGTGTLQAPCAAGRILCQNGGWACFGGRVPEASEVCDGVNNDCRNGVDDGNPGGGGDCGNPAVGECRPGKEECRNGVIQCTGEVGPRAELCDGLDNDCDGTPDEGNPGGNKPCGDVVGVCVKGTTRCVTDPVTGDAVLACVGGDTLKGPEICDGLDNDCNGLVDDGVLSDAPSDPACWPLAGDDCTHGGTTWAAP
ncbi:MAG: hypothetical protein FJ104_10015, partial [Deltaproteobacteria bacterium]|nr:hypothetical protein [Deltaproteobacteria bacterium]